MNTTNLIEFLLLVCALVAALLGPAKLKQLRRDLSDAFESAAELQRLLVLSREEVADLETTLNDAIDELDVLEVKYHEQGPDM